MRGTSPVHNAKNIAKIKNHLRDVARVQHRELRSTSKNNTCPVAAWIPPARDMGHKI